VPDTPIPVRLQTEPRGDGQPVGIDTEILSFTCDGQDVAPEPGRLLPTGILSSRIERTVHLSPKPLGKHTLQAVVRVRVHPFDSQTDHFSDEVTHEMTREARAEFKVVAKPGDLIKLQPDLSLTKELRLNLALQSAYASPSFSSGGVGYAEIKVWIRAQDALPVNVAFEAIGEFGDRSLPLGYLTIRAGEPRVPRSYDLEGLLFGDVPDVLRVRLVASVDAAVTTTGLEQIWDGELDLGTVPVRGAQALRKWLKEQQAGE